MVIWAWAYRALQFRSDAQQRGLVLLPLRLLMLLPLPPLPPLLLRLLCLLLNNLLHSGLILCDEFDVCSLLSRQAEAGSNRPSNTCAG